MRTYEEHQRILQLWERGFNKLAISQITDIPRRTVVDVIKRHENVASLKEQQEQALKLRQQELNTREWDAERRCAYAYLLGMYLGDGYIGKVGRTHKLRISLYIIYKYIMDNCAKAMAIVLPNYKVSFVRVPNTNGGEVCSCTNMWLDLFPQHGKGVKHKRKIELVDWQREITHEYPLEFFRGLYHSDGTRIEPVIYNRVYARYQFTQVSTDIQQIFAETCQQLGIHYTFHGINFTIARRKDVNYLDSVIGPKS